MGFEAYASATSSLLSTVSESSSRLFIFLTSGAISSTSFNGESISRVTIRSNKIKFEPRLKIRV